MDIFANPAMAMFFTEMVKRFVPKKIRKWLNPLIAIATGLFLGYSQNGVDGLIGGITAGGAAIAAYKVPKEIGKKIFKDR